MKKFLLVILFLSVVFASACDKKESLESKELKTIAYPEGYETHQDEMGADAFGGMLDNKDSKYFTEIDYYSEKNKGTFHILEKFKTYQQTTEYTCGPATALMVLYHFGETEYDEMELAEEMHADTTHGTEVEAIQRFFEEIGWKTETHAGTDIQFESIDNFEEYVVKKIDAGIPIMINWTDWGGHWQSIIGIDTMKPDSPYDDVLIIADPYDVTDHLQDGYYTFPFGRFFSMWFEGPCTKNKKPYKQPFIVAYPDEK